MNSSIVELKNDLLDNKDIVICLRKALVISSELKLEGFSKWISNELNGYDASDSRNIPEYRNVHGYTAGFDVFGIKTILNSKDPLRGILNEHKLHEPLSIIIELSKEKGEIRRNLSLETSSILNEISKLKCNSYTFFFNSCYLINIIESVKNALLEWCIKLENARLTENNTNLDKSKIELADDITEKIIINIYNNNSNIALGDLINQNVFNNFDSFEKELKEKIENDDMSEENKKLALAKVENINNCKKEGKGNETIKKLIIDLKDFLFNVGSGVVTYLLTKGL